MKTLITRRLLSAALRAETVRIRSLRWDARFHLACARKHNPKYEEEHRGLWAAFIDATGCPSYRARCANLALGFLKGKPYHQIEYSTRTKTSELYGPLAKEVSVKAEVSHDLILDWMRVPATAAMKEHHANAKAVARLKRLRASDRWKADVLQQMDEVATAPPS